METKAEEFEIGTVKKERAERDNVNKYFVFQLEKLNFDSTKEIKFIGICTEKDSKNLLAAIQTEVQRKILGGGQKFAAEFYDQRYAKIQPVADNLSQTDAMALASEMIVAKQPPWNAILG